MLNKKYNVIISEGAYKMLINHVRFLANISQAAAKKLQKEIISEAQKLEYMPGIYPWLSDSAIVSNKYRKKLVAKRYLIIFQIIEDCVYVDYVLDCRQDYGWLIN